jgi:hypothetical protein
MNEKLLASSIQALGQVDLSGAHPTHPIIWSVMVEALVQ